MGDALRAPIGSGGMGEIWEAYDERLDGRRVAVKMMLAERPSAFPDRFSEDLEIRRARFLREVRTTASVEHLGIPAVHDAGTDEASGRLFVVMQLLTGREIQTLLDEADDPAAPVSVARAAAIGAQVASVLSEVHRRDIVHRDIKPANLILTPGGIVKVLDFGVAALRGAGENPRLTRVGTTVGTPPYMSPEQALGNAVGPTSDVYALACVLHHLLTGRYLFRESGATSYQAHHVRTPPTPVRRLRPEVPEEVEALLLEMLRKEAEERPEAIEVYDRLLALASEPEGPFPADIAELDPCLPFVRPLGAVRRRTDRRASAQAEPAPSLLERDVEEAIERAWELMDDGRLTEAADLLDATRRGTADPYLKHDLSFRLGHVLYLAGRYGDAVRRFEEAGDYFAAQDEPEALIATYFLAQCRVETGDISGAVEAFEAVVAAGHDPADPQSVERLLDALFSLMRLYGVTRRRDAFQDAARSARALIAGQQLENAAELLAEIEEYARRLDRLLAPS